MLYFIKNDNKQRKYEYFTITSTFTIMQKSNWKYWSTHLHILTTTTNMKVFILNKFKFNNNIEIVNWNRKETLQVTVKKFKINFKFTKSNSVKHVLKTIKIQIAYNKKGTQSECNCKSNNIRLRSSSQLSHTIFCLNFEWYLDEHFEIYSWSELRNQYVLVFIYMCLKYLQNVDYTTRVLD